MSSVYLQVLAHLRRLAGKQVGSRGFCVVRFVIHYKHPVDLHTYYSVLRKVAACLGFVVPWDRADFPVVQRSNTVTAKTVIGARCFSTRYTTGPHHVCVTLLRKDTKRSFLSSFDGES